MIGQVVLSALLLGMLLYGCAEVRRSRVIGILIPLVALATLYFVWVPIGAAQVAAALQLGTSHDLILYCWIGLSLLVLLNLHLRDRRQMQFITELIRQIALANGRTSLERASDRRTTTRSQAPSMRDPGGVILASMSGGPRREAEVPAANDLEEALNERR